MVGELCDPFDEAMADDVESVASVETQGRVPGVGPDPFDSQRTGMGESECQETSANTRTLKVDARGHPPQLDRRRSRLLFEWPPHPRADRMYRPLCVDCCKMEGLVIVVAVEFDGGIGHTCAKHFSAHWTHVVGGDEMNRQAIRMVWRVESIHCDSQRYW